LKHKYIKISAINTIIKNILQIRTHSNRKEKITMFKRCKHNWNLTEKFLIDTGLNKLFIYQCGDCSKRKYITLDSLRWWKQHKQDGSII
jgi:hypothetical protein